VGQNCGRHVLDAICHVRMNLRKSAKNVQERLRDAESKQGTCCELAAREPVREYGKLARSCKKLATWVGESAQVAKDQI
jgi:hypothetical protein